MNPQERALVTELFDRLATLEGARRDPDAERVIAEGLARAPNAVYALVQTVLVQDEALNRASARIRELEGESNAPSAGGFLDTARERESGRTSRGSVPSVAAGSKWSTPRADTASSFGAPAASPANYGQEAGRNAPFGGGGSFLGTAAAAAVGVIGGSMLFNGLRNMMGSQAQAFGSPSESGANRSGPWGGDPSQTELAKDAGVNDVGGGASRFGDQGNQQAGLFGDNTGYDSDAESGDDFFSDLDGGFDDGDL